MRPLRLLARSVQAKPTCQRKLGLQRSDLGLCPAGGCHWQRPRGWALRCSAHVRRMGPNYQPPTRSGQQRGCWPDAEGDMKPAGWQKPGRGRCECWFRVKGAPSRARPGSFSFTRRSILSPSAVPPAARAPKTTALNSACTRRGGSVRVVTCAACSGKPCHARYCSSRVGIAVARNRD